MEKNKPLVSYCLLCYNQEEYIAEALNSALNQDYSNLEIIVSDDCSRDNTVGVIQGIVSCYKGSHRVYVNKNKSNLGIVEHFNYVIQNLVHGQYIALAAGDDISFSYRITKSIELIEKYKLNTITFNGEYIDKNGFKLNKRIYERTTGIDVFTLDDYIKKDCLNIHGASRCFYKGLLAPFEPLKKETPTEDTTLTLRAVLTGKVGCCYEPIICYRTHDKNLSGLSSLLKMDYWAIAEQYRYDINDIRDSISEEYYSQLEKKIDRYVRKCELFRLKKRDLFNPKYFFGLVFSRYFSIRGKLSIIKRVLFTNM